MFCVYYGGSFTRTVSKSNRKATERFLFGGNTGTTIANVGAIMPGVTVKRINLTNGRDNKRTIVALFEMGGLANHLVITLGEDFNTRLAHARKTAHDVAELLAGCEAECEGLPDETKNQLVAKVSEIVAMTALG